MNLNDNWVTGVFFLFMFLVLWFYYKNLYSHVQSTAEQLRNINENIKDILDNNVNENFQNIKYILTKDEGNIANIWQLYEKTLVVRSTDNGQSIYSTVCADEYFNIASITEGLNVKFWQNTASFLTGLGILGTFLGLTLGLWNLDFRSTDIVELKEGISNLLGGVNTAFLTSLLGIFLALVFNVFHKRCLENAEKEVQILSNSIENLYPRRSIEQVLDEMLIENKKQAEQLMSFNDGLAISIGDALNDRINSSMGPVFEKLNDAIEKLSQGGSAALSETLQNGIGSELSNFSLSLKALQTTLDRSAAAMEQAGKDSNSRLEVTMDNMTNTLNKLMDDLDNKSKESVNTTNGLLKSVMNEINDNLKTALEQMVETSKAANQDFSNNIIDASKLITDAAEKMRTNSEMGSNTIVDAGDKMRGTIETVLSNVNESVSRQEKTMGFAITKLETLTNNIAELMSNASTAANTFETAARLVAQASDNLNNNINKADETYRLNSGKITEQIDKLSKSVDNTMTSITTLKDGEETVRKNWQAYENRFEGVRGELQQAFTNLDDGLRQYNAHITNGTDIILKKYDQNIADAVNRLSTLVQDLDSTLEPVVEYLEKNKN